MDCDDVFVVLTRAPFPTGCAEIDSPTEEHLAVCDACLRIADALRPAPHLFHEALSPTQCRRLPAYDGDAPSPEAVLAEEPPRHATARRGPVRAGNALARQTRLQREAKRLLRNERPPILLLPKATCDWRDLVAITSLGVASAMGLGGLVWIIL